MNLYALLLSSYQITMKIALNEKDVNVFDLIVMRTLVCAIGGAITAILTGQSFYVEKD